MHIPAGWTTVESKERYLAPRPKNVKIACALLILSSCALNLIAGLKYGRVLRFTQWKAHLCLASGTTAAMIAGIWLSLSRSKMQPVAVYQVYNHRQYPAYWRATFLHGDQLPKLPGTKRDYYEYEKVFILYGLRGTRQEWPIASYKENQGANPKGFVREFDGSLNYFGATALRPQRAPLRPYREVSLIPIRSHSEQPIQYGAILRVLQQREPVPVRRRRGQRVAE